MVRVRAKSNVNDENESGRLTASQTSLIRLRAHFDFPALNLCCPVIILLVVGLCGELPANHPFRKIYRRKTFFRNTYTHTTLFLVSFIQPSSFGRNAFLAQEKARALRHRRPETTFFISPNCVFDPASLRFDSSF